MRTMPQSREAEVWRVLARVADPELDEPVTEMGFVEAIEIDGSDVTVQFRLPTFWCSPNFAFLMAEGIVRELAALPWVARGSVRLEDHMYAAEVNAAANGGASFSEAFAALCDGDDLGALRAKFDEKAFQRRQESVLLRLRALGWSDAAIVAMTLRQLDAIDFEDGEAHAQRPRYREALVRRGLARWPGDLAFRNWGGEPLAVEGFRDYLGRLRQVRLNMEFGGALCRGLAGSRYKETACIDGEPTLVDFIHGRVPARADAR